MIDLISCLSVGRENARTAREIAATLEISDIRTITEIIHNLKVQGEIICACKEGYYLPSDRSDVLGIYRRTISRIRETQKTLPPMENYLKNTEQ